MTAAQTPQRQDARAQRPDGRANHLWRALRRYANPPRPTRTLTTFGRACSALWPWSAVTYPGIEKGITETLHGRAAWHTILDWRFGRRRAPAWAVSLVAAAIRKRVAELQHALEILENEKGAR